MITASIRADGSSRLKDKWCYFPSAALAWDLKQENFLKENSFIDQLKLRLGYGSVGTPQGRNSAPAAGTSRP